MFLSNTFPRITMSNLNIMFWNANSLVQELTEFYDYLSRNEIDIALINESGFKSHISLNNTEYSIYRKDRSDGTRGGVAIFVRKSIKHFVMRDLRCKLIETVGITVQTANQDLHFVAIYVPGGTSTNIQERLTSAY